MSLLTLLSRAGAGGATLTVAPSTGHVILTGKQAAVSQTFSSSLLITPGAGRILLAGKLPTVTLSRGIAPGTGHSLLTGKQPSVTLSRVVAPSAGHVSLSGKQPSLTRSTVITPAAGHVLYSGKQPTLGLARVISPAPGHVLFSGKTPSITQTKNQTIRPGAGRLTFSGHSPVVQYTRWPSPSDVLFGVKYGPTSEDFTGTAVPVAPPAGFASRMTVTLTTERMSVTERPRKLQRPVVRGEVQQISRKQTRQSAEPKLTIAQASIQTIAPSMWIMTQTDEWWILTNKETF